jgi:pyridoxal phosphate enzyme (YggS family)
VSSQPSPTSRVEAYRAARAEVLGRIAAAASRVGRDPAAVTLVAVSKTVTAAALRDALAAGIGLLGENRVQEGSAKAPEVPGARWHLVGPLQSNKARRALEVFDVIQTVDSVDLARRLDRLVPEMRPGGAAYPVLVQVNVDRDPTKAGFAPDAAETELAALLALPHLAVRGLMTVGRLTSDPAEARRTFSELRSLSERCRRRWPDLGPELSMGMSDDFEVAIEEGATIVRVGRALFGERQADEPGHDQRHEHPADRPTSARLVDSGP